MIVDCAVYTHGHRRKGAIPVDDLLEAASEPDSFAWIGLHEPTREEFAAVEKELGLHELAVEDAVKAHQRPKIEQYDDNLFVVLKTSCYDDAEETIDFAEIMLFVGRNYVISVRHGRASALHRVRQSLERRPDVMSLGPMAVLYAVIDHVVDDYTPVIEGLDNDIQEVESEVFSQGRANPAERIYELKREVLNFHSNTLPLLEPLEQLAAGQFDTPSELAPFFRDAADHLSRVTARIDNARVLLSDVLHANLAQISVRQNDDMRKISAWVAIAAVPTMVAGLYGMNFEHMPELDWIVGYPLVLVAIGTACFYLFVRFKRAGWL